MAKYPPLRSLLPLCTQTCSPTSLLQRTTMGNKPLRVWSERLCGNAKRTRKERENTILEGMGPRLRGGLLLGLLFTEPSPYSSGQSDFFTSLSRLYSLESIRRLEHQRLLQGDTCSSLGYTHMRQGASINGW
ncbi:hypothetical protein DdX_11618 [Ditylenchus destructor]|uniref:Uncharacterized protein n=1 Tax=Ditylenchus destructor TaxID=166010 RepID=A0AAD4MWJ8_9BILA|nr:hypothetical protein DdX_11618 [Ditylenchus destructor]